MKERKKRTPPRQVMPWGLTPWQYLGSGLVGTVIGVGIAKTVGVTGGWNTAICVACTMAAIRLGSWWFNRPRPPHSRDDE